jgi:hypothetical protein
LFITAPCQRSHSPSHRQRNGILGSYEGSRLQPLWTRGFGNECGRLFQGIQDIPGTDTCFFIDLKNIPEDRKITYGKIVCDYKPNKQEKERVRLTVGGDRLDYSGDVATSTADITRFKILINSTLSTEDAAMMMMDIKNYYLGTPLPTRVPGCAVLGNIQRVPDEFEVIDWQGVLFASNHARLFEIQRRPNRRRLER